MNNIRINGPKITFLKLLRIDGIYQVIPLSKKPLHPKNLADWILKISRKIIYNIFQS